jgi:hypothetical protein
MVDKKKKTKKLNNKLAGAKCGTQKRLAIPSFFLFRPLSPSSITAVL